MFEVRNEVRKAPEYIERNKAKEALTGWDTDPTDEEIEYALDKIPAADVAAVIHGHIIEHCGYEDRYYCECSVCTSQEVCVDDKFCSECGAKLDGATRRWW